MTPERWAEVGRLLIAARELPTSSREAFVESECRGDAELKAELEKQGRGDIMIVVGGVIPSQDYEVLRAAGAEAIFPPGTVIAEAAVELVKKLNRRLGHEREAAE